MPDSDSASWWRVVDGGIEFSVRATPNAGRSEVVGVVDEVVRVKVAAPPEGGRANDELCRVVAEWFGVRNSAISIVRGHSSRIKTVRVDGVKGPPES